MSSSAAAADGTVYQKKARGSYPGYPTRAQVPDHQVLWSAPFPDYSPVEFTSNHILKKFDHDISASGKSPIDSPDCSKIPHLAQRLTYETKGQLVFDEKSQRPLNPHGRTGMTGRGVLYRWGANHAADPIVTRENPQTGRLEMVAIKRSDTGNWAIPGGMVDPGEKVSATLRREFEEETQNVPESERAEVDQLLDQLFAESNAHVVYKGYVDDPRNTDNAWIETVAAHYHCSDELAAKLSFQAGDDATDARWLAVDGSDPLFGSLHANHKHFVELAVQELQQRRRGEGGESGHLSK